MKFFQIAYIKSSPPAIVHNKVLVAAKNQQEAEQYMIDYEGAHKILHVYEMLIEEINP
jgi:hypothetical protein